MKETIKNFGFNLLVNKDCKVKLIFATIRYYDEVFFRDQTNCTSKNRRIYTLGFHRKTVGLVGIIF